MIKAFVNFLLFVVKKGIQSDRIIFEVHKSIANNTYFKVGGDFQFKDPLHKGIVIRRFNFNAKKRKQDKPFLGKI